MAAHNAGAFASHGRGGASKSAMITSTEAACNHCIIMTAAAVIGADSCAICVCVCVLISNSNDRTACSKQVWTQIQAWITQ